MVTYTYPMIEFYEPNQFGFYRANWDLCEFVSASNGRTRFAMLKWSRRRSTSIGFRLAVDLA